VNAPPPLLISFSTPEKLFEALPEKTLASYQVEIETLLASKYPPAVSLHVLSTLLGTSTDFIGALINTPERHYRRFTIRKGKKKRQIEAPRVALKLIQGWIGHHLSRAISLAPCVHGFIPGKNGILTAASIHCHANWVLSLDLRDFFPSIAAKMVEESLQMIGYRPHAAEFITKICTIDDRLPQGSPASPVLSNLAFSTTDRSLQEIASNIGVRYSRYADDLVFSGTNATPPSELLALVTDVIITNGWTVAEEKTHLAIAPQRLKVHGLLVHGERPRLTKGYRNRIRAYKHLLAGITTIPDKDLEKMRGHIAYSGQVDSV
jgi:RNA-directed DNA polymerase